MSESIKYTLHELATRHGQIAPAVDGGSPYLGAHRVAASIHGWDAHDYHYQADPVMLTDAVYLEALKSGATSYERVEGAVPVPPTPDALANRIKEQAELNREAKIRKARADDAAKAEDEAAAKAAKASE